MEALQGPEEERSLEQVQSLVVGEVLKDVETACKLLNITPGKYLKLLNITPGKYLKLLNIIPGKSTANCSSSLQENQRQKINSFSFSSHFDILFI